MKWNDVIFNTFYVIINYNLIIIIIIKLHVMTMLWASQVRVSASAPFVGTSSWHLMTYQVQPASKVTFLKLHWKYSFWKPFFTLFLILSLLSFFTYLFTYDLLGVLGPARSAHQDPWWCCACACPPPMWLCPSAISSEIVRHLGHAAGQHSQRPPRKAPPRDMCWV